MNSPSSQLWVRLVRLRKTYVNGEEDVASSRQFHALLARECCRADRSGGVFSVILFQLEERTRHSLELDQVVSTLQRRLRISDQIGWSSDGSLGVFLPDTPSEGAHNLAQEIMQLLPVGISKFAYAVRSYPFDWGLDAAPGEGLAIRGDSSVNSSSATPGFRTKAAAAIELAGTLPWWKRAMDVTGALVGIVALSPVMIAIAAAVKLTSPGPILYRQRRIGYLGREFLIYKFRSMTAGTSEAIHVDYVREMIRGTAQQQGGGAFKLVEDPRVTRVGRFIRKWSLDELPQLINVLKGEMSLVGPRPDPIYARADYHPWYHRRILHVRPGLTGLWQVEGRSRVTFEEMIRLDLRYSNSLSFVTDVGILFRTFRAVLSHTGAY
jgi:lipopolysaccharide/colanic/teichoic acid biosynthesis glycosyltransferase